MVDKEVVLKRLNNLKDNLNYLKGIKDFSKNEFSSDPDIYFRYERSLHLAIEAVLDIGNHLIADQRLRTPESNRDIFKILVDNNIIDKDLSEKLMKMAGFRNILVHDYLSLDRELEYEIILNNINDIKEFIKIVVKYI
ncbi:MAG: type VII toxin-antitoxin system HepT family RNase toxin [Halothermotrichaceae bacterium]